MGLHTSERLHAYTDSGWWTTDTWRSLFHERVSERPHEVACVDPPNRETFITGPQRSLTWQELSDDVMRMARVLYSSGVRQETVVGVQLPNTVEQLITYLAIVELGGVICPFPIQYRRHELQVMCELSRIKIIVTADRIKDYLAANNFLEFTPLLRDAPSVLAFGRELPAGVFAAEGPGSVRADAEEVRQYAASLTISANDCVTICWTSGTEGVPKGVPRANADWVYIGKRCAAPVKLTSDSVMLATRPMVNQGAFGGVLVPWLLHGFTLVLHHPFDLTTYLEQVQTYGVTHSSLPPALLMRLLKDPNLPSNLDLSSLRSVTMGSAPAVGWVIAAWRDRYGVDICNFFGSSEGIGLISDPDTVPDPEIRARCFPIPNQDAQKGFGGTEIRLVDIYTDNEIKEPGIAGELRVRGPGVFSGYLDHERLGLVAFDDFGYLHSGDQFEYVDIDEPTGRRRYLRFTGRIKEIANRGGMKISTPEIEALLSDHADIAEVAVVPYSDSEMGERVCAWVIPQPGHQINLKSIGDHLTKLGVARFKHPERLELLLEFPRNPAGKVIKSQLRARLDEPDS